MAMDEVEAVCEMDGIDVPRSDGTIGAKKRQLQMLGWSRRGGGAVACFPLEMFPAAFDPSPLTLCNRMNSCEGTTVNSTKDLVQWPRRNQEVSLCRERLTRHNGVKRT
jgi:hypothetical protein